MSPKRDWYIERLDGCPLFTEDPATVILKDNALVEVDANHGIIRILKN